MYEDDIFRYALRKFIAREITAESMTKILTKTARPMRHFGINHFSLTKIACVAKNAPEFRRCSSSIRKENHGFCPGKE